MKAGTSEFNFIKATLDNAIATKRTELQNKARTSFFNPFKVKEKKIQDALKTLETEARNWAKEYNQKNGTNITAYTSQTYLHFDGISNIFINPPQLNKIIQERDALLMKLAMGEAVSAEVMKLIEALNKLK